MTAAAQVTQVLRFFASPPCRDGRTSVYRSQSSMLLEWASADAQICCRLGS